jgi:hypothetical protein
MTQEHGHVLNERAYDEVSISLVFFGLFGLGK